VSRWWLVLAAVSGVVFVGLSVALRVQLMGGGEGTAAQPGTAPAARQELGVAVDRRPPAVVLRDAEGRRTTLASFRGRWVVVLPSLTLCHEVCPLTTAAAMRLQRLLGAAGAGGRVAVVEISVDPWRDSPQRLRAYRRLTGADFPMLTGSLGALRRLWGFFGIGFERLPADQPPDRDWMTGKPERFDVEHTDGAFVIDPQGVERLAVSGMPSVGGRVEPALARLLNEQGHKNLAHPKPGWSAVALAGQVEEMMGLDGGANGAGSGSTGRGGAAGASGGGGAAGASGGALHSGTDLSAALEAARGGPAVVNVWASWCPPCREEVPLFAAAARRFGDRIAFLGADLEDDEGAARGFLRRAGVDYPSYPADDGEVGELLGPVQGTPLTFYLDSAGKVVDEHIGAYRSAAELDADVIRHASATGG
jgi:cytochrome oxidase Cu insertion factor (SCO1/SenC/PrrC family)/thiol-disulfide isomerase/thioredoxin